MKTKPGAITGGIVLRLGKDDDVHGPGVVVGFFFSGAVFFKSLPEVWEALLSSAPSSSLVPPGNTNFHGML
jgi:hypothetical protein